MGQSKEMANLCENLVLPFHGGYLFIIKKGRDFIEIC